MAKRNKKVNKVNDLVTLIEKRVESLSDEEIEQLVEKLNAKSEILAEKKKLEDLLAPYDLYEVSWNCKMAVFAQSLGAAIKTAETHYDEAVSLRNPSFKARLAASKADAQDMKDLSIFYDERIFKANDHAFSPPEKSTGLAELKGYK